MSRGMLGYGIYEHVVIELDGGPGTLSFTDFNTVADTDVISLDIYHDGASSPSESFSFSGSDQPPDTDIVGFTRITWNTGFMESQGAGYGWVLKFTRAITTTTTMTMTTTTETTTTTLRRFSFDVSSMGCKVDAEQECLQNLDFPSMTNASEILCTGETNLVLYSTAFQTDGDANLTMYDMYNPSGDDDAKLWFSDFPGKSTVPFLSHVVIILNLFAH